MPQVFRQPTPISIDQISHKSTTKLIPSKRSKRRPPRPLRKKETYACPPCFNIKFERASFERAGIKQGEGCQGFFRRPRKAQPSFQDPRAFLCMKKEHHCPCMSSQRGASVPLVLCKVHVTDRPSRQVDVAFAGERRRRFPKGARMSHVKANARHVEPLLPFFPFLPTTTLSADALRGCWACLVGCRGDAFPHRSLLTFSRTHPLLPGPSTGENEESTRPP